MAKASLKLVESKKEIEKRIVKALAIDINKALDKVITRSLKPIQDLVKISILNQPEVSSLSGGQLAGEFGLPDGRNRIESIVQIWTKGIKISKNKAILKNGKIQAGFTINMVPSDYSDVLSSPFAALVTEKGQQLNWLEWLLRFGDRAIIRDYNITFDSSKTKRSRTGIAIMQGARGSTWRVPPQFAGTDNNNFVTRALDDIQDEVTLIIQNQLKSAIR